MKRNVVLLVVTVALVGIVLISGCIQGIDPAGETPKKTPIATKTPANTLTQVKINITQIKWSKAVQYQPESSILETKIGESFGPSLYGNLPFKITEITDQETATLLFNDADLVIADDPVNKQYKEKTLKISTKDVCFRTRTADSGTDICLKIVPIKEPTKRNIEFSYDWETGGLPIHYGSYYITLASDDRTVIKINWLEYSEFKKYKNPETREKIISSKDLDGFANLIEKLGYFDSSFPKKRDLGGGATSTSDGPRTTLWIKIDKQEKTVHIGDNIRDFEDSELAKFRQIEDKIRELTLCPDFPGCGSE